MYQEHWEVWCAMLCSAGNIRKQNSPAAALAPFPSHFGEPHLAAPCALSLLCLYNRAQDNLQNPFSPPFWCWFMKKDKPFAVRAIGVEKPFHYRNKHYFRIDVNSATQIKRTYSSTSKWQHQGQWFSSLFRGRSSKLWILPESISKQDELVFLDVG